MDKFLIILSSILLTIIVVIIISIPFTILWNWLMPMIFGLTKIKIWHGIGLLAMASLLFKSSSNKK
jgi:hypothetical protein